MTDGHRLVQTALDPKLFQELLNGPSTYRILYGRAHPCPCWDEMRSGPDQSCPVCLGRGSYWDDPDAVSATTYTAELVRGSLNDDEILSPLPSQVLSVTMLGENGAPDTVIDPAGLTWNQAGAVSWADGLPQPTEYAEYDVHYQAQSPLRALIQRVTSVREFQGRGEFQTTDLQITVDRHQDDGTPNPAWDAGSDDRFTLLDTWRRHQTHVKRGDEGVPDALVYRRVRDVTCTSLLAAAVHTWQPGVDFTADQAGNISWAVGHGPESGRSYAVECHVSPEYFLWLDLPQTRQIGGADLPRKFVLRGFEMFGNRK
jgi:hypothetical protein